MTDFFQIICYNSDNTPSTIEIIEIWVNIFGGIITGVIAIVGLFCFKSLKDKARAATFTFWSQIKIRLEMIRKWIEIDYGILDNLYYPFFSLADKYYPASYTLPVLSYSSFLHFSNFHAHNTIFAARNRKISRTTAKELSLLHAKRGFHRLAVL